MLSHSRKETNALNDKLMMLVEYLINYASNRPSAFAMKKLGAEAKAFWDELIKERKSRVKANFMMGKIVSTLLAPKEDSADKSSKRSNKSKIDIASYVNSKRDSVSPSAATSVKGGLINDFLE